MSASSSRVSSAVLRQARLELLLRVAARLLLRAEAHHVLLQFAALVRAAPELLPAALHLRQGLLQLPFDPLPFAPRPLQLLQPRTKSLLRRRTRRVAPRRGLLRGAARLARGDQTRGGRCQLCLQTRHGALHAPSPLLLGLRALLPLLHIVQQPPRLALRLALAQLGHLPASPRISPPPCLPAAAPATAPLPAAPAWTGRPPPRAVPPPPAAAAPPRDWPPGPPPAAAPAPPPAAGCGFAPAPVGLAGTPRSTGIAAPPPPPAAALIELTQLLLLQLRPQSVVV